MSRKPAPQPPLTIGGIEIHPHVTIERIIDAVDRQMFTLDNPGFCIACGEEADECDPDTRRARCDYCDKPAVYGAMELIQMIS